ncbi:unnamed protein product [Ceratitis capitata]|uniref:(Mediterranean fruit fly) hypothetical protein n=1 Tax=Ceratitis capitata TaxID=7213 RepID=A0A811VHB9_CERCA|nr:unnamed protein product [Ceratitis capitata]
MFINGFLEVQPLRDECFGAFDGLLHPPLITKHQPPSEESPRTKRKSNGSVAADMALAREVFRSREGSTVSIGKYGSSFNLHVDMVVGVSGVCSLKTSKV